LQKININSNILIIHKYVNYILIDKKKIDDRARQPQMREIIMTTGNIITNNRLIVNINYSHKNKS
jgi:hypothetical protein